MNPVNQILARVPDCDDALRRLADVLDMPPRCRRRTCRREGRCQGGYGPPCYFADRERFASALGEGMQVQRDCWTRRRRDLAALLRRGQGGYSASSDA